MSNEIPAEIRIGGPIPKKLLKELGEIVEWGALCLDGYDGPTCFDIQEALTTMQKAGKTLDLFSPFARNGVFEELEKFLQAKKIAFCRHSDGDSYFVPEISVYLPEKMDHANTVCCDDEESPVISLKRLRILLAENKDLQVAQVIERLAVFEQPIPPVQLI
jgi:hypothetical protein